MHLSLCRDILFEIPSTLPFINSLTKFYIGFLERPIPRNSIHSLCQCNQLKSIELSNITILPEAIKSTSLTFSQSLEKFTWDSCPAECSESLQHLLAQCQNLQTVQLGSFQGSLENILLPASVTEFKLFHFKPLLNLQESTHFLSAIENCHRLKTFDLFNSNLSLDNRQFPASLECLTTSE